MATAGRAVTVTRGMRDHGVRGLTCGACGRYLFRPHARVGEGSGGKKEVCGHYFFAHTWVCGLFLLYTTQNVWADPLTPTRVALIDVLEKTMMSRKMFDAGIIYSLRLIM